MNRRLLLRLVVAVSFLFSAMTAAWSWGGYVRTRATVNVLAGVGFTVLTLVLAWYLKHLTRRK